MKKQKDEKQYFGYSVKIAQYCDFSEREDVEYGSWEDSWSNSLESTCIRDEKYPSITSTLDIPKGSNALVVWAEWDTGDSFGNSHNGTAEPFGIFLDMDAARGFADWLKSQREEGIFNEDSKKFVAADGQVFEIRFFPWTGYFESLSGVHIDVVCVF